MNFQRRACLPLGLIIKNMVELIFVIFNDPKEGYSAVEGKYSLMVVGRDRAQLLSEIKNAVLEYFNGNFKGRITLREFTDQELFL